MNANRHISKVIYFSLSLGIFFSAATLFAEESPVFKGTFTLPFETRWGTAVLPPGDYTLSVHSTALPARVMVRGKDGSSLIFAEALATRRGSNHSTLFVVRNARQGLVRSLYVVELGMMFYYATPKSERTLIAEGPELIHLVAVTRAGK